MEAVRPSVISDILASAEAWAVAEEEGGAGYDDDDDGRGGGGGGCGAAPRSALGPSRGGDGASVRSGGTARTGATSSGGASSSGLTTRARVQSACARCGYMTSAGAGAGGALGGRALCQACTLLAGLEAGTPRLGLTSGRQARRMAEAVTGQHAQAQALAPAAAGGGAAAGALDHER